MEKADKHRYRINKADSDNVLYLCVGFEDEDGIYASIYNNVQSNMCVDNNKDNADNECAADTFAVIKENVYTFWHNYWSSGKFLCHENDELMRRVILSQYLLIVNDSGYIPPAETGLTCNSWYGKAHLEMHYWHMAWAALWGHPELLEKALTGI